MKRRILSMITALALCLSMLPPVAFAAEVDESLCPHHPAHTADCGYSAPTEGAPYTYDCRICPVQVLIDALPDADAITAEIAPDVEAQLAAIDDARAALTDEELDALDTARYEAAVSALLALEGMKGANVPELLATNYDVSTGNVVISTNGDYTITGSTTTKTITVESGVSANITLDNVNIKLSASSGKAAFTIEDNSTGNVTVTLEGTNTLESGANRAGLEKNGSNGTLTITGSGSLTATGGSRGAGIGGGQGGSAANITINGGDITANGGSSGAGIGGGEGGSGTNITIGGGTVKATGCDSGAGIGSGSIGSSGTSGDVTIKGGDITANGGNRGAGIGGGTGNTVIIEGGKVTATAGSSGHAGIGGGYGGSGSVTIKDGTVDATGGYSGAGIGGGSSGTGTVIIEGGIVTATSAIYGAGIGGGQGGSGEVTIKGGTVKATGGNGAGIGGGSGSSSGNVTITGGTVTATGSSWSAGIGGGKNNNGGTVTISGGTVTASTNSSSGAGIGNGNGGSGCTFSTGENGSAWIEAGNTNSGAAVSDTSGQGSSWNGIIFQNGAGQVYGYTDSAGLYKLEANAAIPSGATLTIPEGASLYITSGTTLTVPEGTEIINNGALDIEGTLEVNGTITSNKALLLLPTGELTGRDGSLSGDGSFITQRITTEMIAVDPIPAYNGNDRSEDIRAKVKLQILGHDFQTDSTSFWTLSVEPKEGSVTEYTVAYTKFPEIVTKTVTLAQSGTNLTATLAGNKTEYEFDETITINATVKASGEAPDAPAMLTATFNEPPEGQVAVYKRDGETETQVSTAAEPDANGSCTFSIPAKDLGAGTHTLTVKYIESTVMAAAEQTLTVTVAPAPLPEVTLSQDSFTYNGGEQKPTVIISGLTEGTDYEISYSRDGQENTNLAEAGVITVTVTGKGNYAGTKVKTYTIKQAVPVITWSNPTETLTYTGNPAAITPPTVTLVGDQAPAVQVVYSYEKDGKTITGLPTDAGVYQITASLPEYGSYTAAESTNTLVLTIEKSTPTIAFKADYTPDKDYDATVIPDPAENDLEISGAKFEDVQFTWTQGGTAATPQDAGTYTLTATIPETNNTAPFSITKEVTISPKNVPNPIVELSPDSFVYDGTEKEPAVTVKDGEAVIPAGEYTVEYGNNVNVGTNTATVTITDKDGGNYIVSGTATFTITAASISDAQVTVDGSYTYTGQAQTPTADNVTVALGGKALVKDTDYTYDVTDNVNAGTATVTVTGKGNYTGTATGSFTIAKAALTIKANDQTVTYGDSIATGLDQVTATGLATDDTLASVTLTASTKNVPGGSITPSAAAIQSTGATDVTANYAITYEAGDLTINKATNVKPPAENTDFTVSYPDETLTLLKNDCEIFTAQENGEKVDPGSITAYLGQTLYIRKVEDSNHEASDWAEIKLAARPAAPTLTVKGETLLGQKDGSVTTTGSGLEYSEDGGKTWKDYTAALTGLAAGTKVEVRVKATASAPASLSAAYEVEAGEPITVTFEGGAPGTTTELKNQTGLSYKDKATKPADPVPNDGDYVFTGWYNGGTEWTFDTPLEQSLTLTAQWKRVKFDLTVTVTNSDTSAAQGAAVTLKKGKEVVMKSEQPTGPDGKLTLPSIPIGAYNAVVEKDGQTTTALVTITGEDEANDKTLTVALPPAGANSTLTVTGNDTPDIVVGGLDEEAAAKLAADTTVTKVTVTMTVEEKPETSMDQAAVTAIKEAAETKSTPVLEYLDVVVKATITKADGTTEEKTGNTTRVMTLVVPFSFDGKQSVTVYHYDGTTATALNKAVSNTGTDKTYYTDEQNGLLYIYAQDFSPYVIGYAAEFTITFDPNGGSGSQSTVKTGSNGKLPSGTLPTNPTRNGYTFNGWYVGNEKVTENTVFKTNATVTARWTKKSNPGGTGSGGGSGYPAPGGGSGILPSNPTYAVTVQTPEHGSVTSGSVNASQGSTVTLTVTPDSGYALDTLTVSNSQGSALTLTDKGGGQYSFTMPSGAVTVTATFAPLPDGVQQPCDGGTDCPSHAFADLGGVGTWYHEAVDYVLRNNLMNGRGDGSFGPNLNLSRAQLAQILYNHAGRPAVGASSFIDVKGSAWYADSVAWAAETGVVTGYAGYFSPDDPITREQLAVMLWRYAGSPAATDRELHFADADEVSAWALDALRWAVENGIVNGKGGLLDPAGEAARAEAATMLVRYMRDTQE